MNENRVPAGVPTGGRFAASAKGEAGVALDEVTASRDELIAAPEFQHMPSTWLAEKTDAELAEGLAAMRAQKEQVKAEQVKAEQATRAEAARRRAYRRPGWLRRVDVVHDVEYHTSDGYRAVRVIEHSDGRARSVYIVKAPRRGEIATVERVEQIAETIEADRAATSVRSEPTGTVLDQQMAVHEVDRFADVPTTAPVDEFYNGWAVISRD